ncbi:MAG: lipoate--protein ligase family protein [Verrucomicrobiota bacterium]
MQLHLLPDRADSAAGNMAADFLLLQHYPAPQAARFRHYDWHRPAVTFGYSQKIAFVREQLPALLGPDTDPADLTLCRRPSGGGVVDHRDDWTYALVLPRGHDLADAPAPVSYQRIHADLAAALNDLGHPATLQETCPAQADCNLISDKPARPAPGPTVCFTRAEKHDVIDPATGRKLAGAAQKRSKHGLLCQGSVDRAAVGEINWDAFAVAFTTRLAATLGAEAVPTPWPDFPEDAHENLADHYATPEWNTFR